jgi:hypothetical protein
LLRFSMGSSRARSLRLLLPNSPQRSKFQSQLEYRKQVLSHLDSTRVKLAHSLRSVLVRMTDRSSPLDSAAKCALDTKPTCKLDEGLRET